MLRIYDYYLEDFDLIRYPKWSPKDKLFGTETTCDIRCAKKDDGYTWTYQRFHKIYSTISPGEIINSTHIEPRIFSHLTSLNNAILHFYPSLTHLYYHSDCADDLEGWYMVNTAGDRLCLGTTSLPDYLWDRLASYVEGIIEIAYENQSLVLKECQSEFYDMLWKPPCYR